MRYAIVDAQGHYGSHTRVYRTFATLEAADKAAKRGSYAVVQCELAKGAKVHAADARRYEQHADADRAEAVS